MSQDQIIADLDGLIKTAAEVETEGLAKQASPGDPLNSDNGTSSPETGAQMASNNEEAGKHTAAKVDGGAETNPSGASVTMSTDGATAVSTDGQEGTQGADLTDKHTAANGDEGGLSGDPADLDKKTASELIASARKQAGELKVAAAKLPVDDKAASATKKLASVLGKADGQGGVASADLTEFDRLLAKRAQEAMPEGEAEMAEPEAAAAGAEQILAGLQSGEIGEEEAAALLEQAAQSGALTEEDIAELDALAQGAMAEGAGGGEAMPPEAAAGGMPPEAMGGAMPPPAEDEMAMKVASLDIGPDHPQYGQKLARFHGPAIEFGKQLAIKTAMEVAGETDEETGGEDGKPSDPPISGEAAVEGMPPAEPEAPGLEAGLAEGGGDAPPAEGIVDAMAAPGDIAPTSPEEEAALAEVLGELGMEQEGADALMAAPIPEMDKVASFKARVRGALLAKSAALRTAKNQKKD